MKIPRPAKAGAAATLICGLAAMGLAGPAFASAQTQPQTQTFHNYTFTLDFSTNPNTTLEPAFMPPLEFPQNCPFDSSAVFTITGNAVVHQTGNNNGFWLSETGNGPATLTNEGAMIYSGRVTAWGGLGTNQGPTDSTGQAEEGTTFHFHGTNSSGGSLDVSIDYHVTLNNAGTMTSSSEDMTCS